MSLLNSLNKKLTGLLSFFIKPDSTILKRLLLSFCIFYAKSSVLFIICVSYRMARYSYRMFRHSEHNTMHDKVNM